MSFRNFSYTSSLFLSVLIAMAGCKDDPYTTPEPKTELSNDAIKRSIGPNLVGQQIEFAYAMALPATKGKLTSAQVEASIAGAPATFLENRSFSTSSGGVDVPVTVATPSTNNGAVTSVTFNRDTMAATLRYYYVVPEEARGKTVSFKFTAKSSDGATVSYDLGPYTVSKMDMKLDVVLTDATTPYLSIADMAALTPAQAAATPDKVDLVYLHRTTPASFAHALVAPNTDAAYRPGITLPTGVNRATKLVEVLNLRDKQLARLQYGVYVDDPDMKAKSFATASSFAINIKAESGVWVETADGKYRAYVYINAVNASAKTTTVSIKRYQMQ